MIVSRLQRIAVALAVVVPLWLIGGDTPNGEHLTAVYASLHTRPSANISDDLAPPVRLLNALEGLDTTDYRMTMMLCEED